MALIVFLSHIGSFVPADAAIVGLTDRCLILHISVIFLIVAVNYCMLLITLSPILLQQDILCNGKQAYDCRKINIHDRSASSRDDAKVNFIQGQLAWFLLMS